MSHTPVGGHPQGWEHKLADRSSLPPASGEEKARTLPRHHVFTHPHVPAKRSSINNLWILRLKSPPKLWHLSRPGTSKEMGAMAWREETEGSSAGSPAPASPPYLRWAKTLHDLLEDAEGVRLFRKFVLSAGKLHTDRLDFYFAVLGLRQETDPRQTRQTVSVIYKFLRRSQLAFPEALKQQVKQMLRDGADIDRHVFDDMEQEVTRAITETTYLAFLRSEAYISYVSANTQPLSPEPTTTTTLGNKEMCAPSLATVHEGQELSAAPARLTHDALLATQSRRLHSEIAPAGTFGPPWAYSAHLSYAGYCPASRRDSERASLSSGRADSTSLESLSVRGSREGRGERQARPRIHGLDKNAVINKEQDTAMMIPRTGRVSSEQLRVLPPAEFAPLLIERLERVRRERDAADRLERRLAEGDGEEAATQALPPQLVAAAIREKLQLDDDNDQDILDQHVSRVWSERTPERSPPARARRPVSALSADSGHYTAHSDRSHPHLGPLLRRSFGKKASTEFTDSGVSVVSERSGLERGSRASSADRKHARGRACGSATAGASKAAGLSSTEACTVVVVSFLDEPVPYRLRVPASPLTLRVFKDYLPRKGNYRYFFKTECADLDNTVIQEEVSCDSDILPMFEGKVMARVKTIE